MLFRSAEGPKHYHKQQSFCRFKKLENVEDFPIGPTQNYIETSSEGHWFEIVMGHSHPWHLCKNRLSRNSKASFLLYPSKTNIFWMRQSLMGRHTSFDTTGFENHTGMFGSLFVCSTPFWGAAPAFQCPLHAAVVCFATMNSICYERYHLTDLFRARHQRPRSSCKVCAEPF